MCSFPGSFINRGSGTERASFDAKKDGQESLSVHSAGLGPYKKFGANRLSICLWRCYHFSTSALSFQHTAHKV